jgi:nitrous oxide reductase accessory protein NosL
MNLHKQLAALLVILALAECTQMATEQEPTPYARYSRDSGQTCAAVLTEAEAVVRDSGQGQ